MSVTNQKVVYIHKRKDTGNFLQIGIDEMRLAQQQMTYCEFVLYLYLAGNANGFKLELSDKKQVGTIVKLLSIRYSLATVFSLIFYFLLPFDLEVRQALVILAFSPIGSAVPGFTEQLKGDVGLSSALNSFAMVISISITVALLLMML